MSGKDIPAMEGNYSILHPSQVYYLSRKDSTERGCNLRPPNLLVAFEASSYTLGGMWGGRSTLVVANPFGEVVPVQSDLRRYRSPL